MAKKRFLFSSKKATIWRLFDIVGKTGLFVGILLIQAALSGYASPSVLPAIGAASGMTTYMGGNSRINYEATETLLNKGNIARLKMHWQQHANGVIDTQPVISNGVIYWASWNGYEHATTLNGRQLWQTFLGKDTPPGNCLPASAGVASTATVSTTQINGKNTSVVFVGGGDASFYALNASNGAIIWKTALGTPPNEMIWAGSAVYKGSIYVGISSYGDCPLTPGSVFRLNETTGAIQSTFHTTANNCNGAGVWDAPSIDAATNTLFVSTGTLTLCSQYESLAYAVLQLRTSNLTLVHSWQIPPAQQAFDSDFGTTPTLFTARIGGAIHPMLGLLDKNGHYYAFDRANISAGPRWERKLAGTFSNIAASAWDGTKLYIGTAATNSPGQRCRGSVWALNPATGQTSWVYCAPGKIVAAPTVIPGLVIVGSGSHLIILDTATGQPKFTYSASGTFLGSATVFHGVLYIGNSNGNLYAFGL